MSQSSMSTKCICVPGGQTILPAMLQVIPCEYVDEPYIAKKLDSLWYTAVETASLYVRVF